MDELVQKVRGRIKNDFSGEGTGHDWWHILRVVNNALAIQKKEGGDKELIELSALVHDVGDHKFHDDPDAQRKLITGLLGELGASQELISQVLKVVKQVSFKGGKENLVVDSIEAKIVQDADRLDALGAIGIARAFAYGGSKGRMIYDPDQKPKDFETFEAYKNDNGHTINHFYEKLLRLQQMMQTETGRSMAAQRHEFMEGYLHQFYKEWDGEI
ncbi:MAG: HD domain-containing protein [Flavobacteriales bacterium]|nr:HD domain-containing protein [Flavobacteriales bacterium]